MMTLGYVPSALDKQNASLLSLAPLGEHGPEFIASYSRRWCLVAARITKSRHVSFFQGQSREKTHESHRMEGWQGAVLITAAGSQAS